MRDSCIKIFFTCTCICAAVILAIFISCEPEDPCSQSLSPGDDHLCTIDMGGCEGEREYYVYAPHNYDPSKATALIVDAHGAMETAEVHAGLETEFCPEETMGCGSEGLCWTGKGSGWRLEADQPGGGFIVVTPRGVNNVWSEDDESFILDIIDHVRGIANIDPGKVYMTGISNGGLLTYWVGCPNSDVFSGLSPIAGGSDCSYIRNPIPVITFDNELDFAYATSTSASDTMVDLYNCSRISDIWVTVDSSYNEPVCRDDPFSPDPAIVPCSSIYPPIEPTVCRRWKNCDGGVEVVFCDVAAANPHGDGNESLDAHVIYGNASHLNLPSLAWRFFKRFQ